MSEYLWQYQIILLLYNCEICLNICTLSVCFWNMCPGAEVEYNDCVIHILTAMALIKHKHTQITTTQSAWTPTDTSGLDHLHSTTSDNNNTQSIFFSFPQVCVCVCVLSLIPVIFSVPQLLGGQTYGGQNYHGACMPSQRPNRGISPIGSVVFHHTQTTTHTLTLARNAAWTSRRKQMHARKYTQMHVYTHTMTDCSSLIWCFSQWFISILWPGNCLRNTCSEKTHSDDLDQIEALPSATDNSGLEWRQNFKEREREGETASRQDVPQMIKQGELISTQWSARQKNTLLCVCVCPLNEYAQSKLFTFTSIKQVKLCGYIYTFLLLSCGAVNCSVPLINPCKTTWRGNVFCFLWYHFDFWGNWFAKKTCIKKDLSIYFMSEE